MNLKQRAYLSLVILGSNAVIDSTYYNYLARTWRQSKRSGHNGLVGGKAGAGDDVVTTLLRRVAERRLQDPLRYPRRPRRRFPPRSTPWHRSWPSPSFANTSQHHKITQHRHVTSRHVSYRTRTVGCKHLIVFLIVWFNKCKIMPLVLILYDISFI